MKFIGISDPSDLAAVQKFIDDTGTSGFPQIQDVDGSLWKQFETSGRSTFMFINDDGTTDLTTYGAVRGEELRAGVERLIAS